MDLISILKENNEENMKQYLFQYGKSPKPVAPFYFEAKEDYINGRTETVNGRTNEADSESNHEAEVSE